MRRRFIYNEQTGRMEEVDINAPREARMQIMTDLDQSGQSYQSPTTFRWITSRRQMREDLKATGCRQVDPGEKKEFTTPPKMNWSF